MKKLTKVDVAINGLLAGLVKLVKQWEAGTLGSETEYRDSLLKFIRSSVPEDCRVEREYRHGGTTADLFISWKGLLFSGEVFVEIKRNLQKKASFDRLVGQLEGLEPGKRGILVVLVGSVDEGLHGRLRDRYASFMGDLVDEGMMAIVVKR